MKGLMILVTALLMICAGSRCSAQEARVVEALPDGGYVIAIGGKEYRAVTDEQLRQIQERKIKLTACEQELALADQETAKLKDAVALALKDAQLASAQTAIERERAGRFEALFNGEHELRLQSELLIKRGRVSRFFDKPWVQVAVKLGIPIVGAMVNSGQ